LVEEIFIAGAGGQGVLALGKTLALSAVEQGLYVTYYPSYGAEIRGGTANCTVIISDREIASPTVSKAKSLLVLNAPSFLKFLPKLVSDGLLIVNSSLVDISKNATNFTNKISKLIQIPATAIAKRIGDVRCANMVMLGVYTEAKKIISSENVIKVIKNIFSKKQDIANLNIKAFKEGLSYETEESKNF